MEQCKIKDVFVGKYLKAESAKSMLDAQVEFSKHVAICQEESCKLSLVSRVGIGLQSEDGTYLKDEAYMQEELDEIMKEESEEEEENDEEQEVDEE